MSNTTDNTKRRAVRFAALDPYIQRNIPKPVEIKSAGTDFVKWGTRNRYPEYLLELYNKSTTLRAVVDGCVDYIAGNAVLFRGEKTKMLNQKDSARDIVRLLGSELKRVGGFALEIVRDYKGGIAEAHSVDLRYLRTNEENDVFWYSERWNKGNPDPEVRPAFIPYTPEEWAGLPEETRRTHAASIYFYKESRLSIYPTPCYLASVPACEMEANIDDFHLNGLENGFAASAVMNFHNGVPGDDEQDEIERNVNEKFSGHQNALRIMLAFDDDKEHGVELQQFDVKDFGDKFKALETTSARKIFTAFRANPNLFGIPTESNGFNAEEYESAFKLFNRTQIQPAQRAIAEAFEKIWGEPVLTIVPFTLEGEDEQIVK